MQEDAEDQVHAEFAKEEAAKSKLQAKRARTISYKPESVEQTPMHGITWRTADDPEILAWLQSLPRRRPEFIVRPCPKADRGG